MTQLLSLGPQRIGSVTDRQNTLPPTASCLSTARSTTGRPRCGSASVGTAATWSPRGGGHRRNIHGPLDDHFPEDTYQVPSQVPSRSRKRPLPWPSVKQRTCPTFRYPKKDRSFIVVFDSQGVGKTTSMIRSGGVFRSRISLSFGMSLGHLHPANVPGGAATESSRTARPSPSDWGWRSSEWEASWM